MSHEIGIVMGGYLDENKHLMDRAELNKRISLKDEEINSLKEELNNSKNFHCEHFLTDDSGTISCHKKFRDYQLEEKYNELGKAHVELVKTIEELKEKLSTLESKDNK